MQASEHLQALTHGLGARAQALVRQGFPRRKLKQFEIVDQIAKGCRNILCFSTGCHNDKLHGAELFFAAKFRQKCDNCGMSTGRCQQI